MRRKKEEYIGEKFGKWTVIGVGKEGGAVLCRCECGTERGVRMTKLKNGGSKSCGCTLGGNNAWHKLGKEPRVKNFKNVGRMQREYANAIP